MRNMSLMVIALALGAVACETDAFSTGPSLDRVYSQVERLGNPLVSEVTLAKRNHAFHNTTGPSTDAANFTAELEAFVTQAAGRAQAVADVLSSVLLPDMLIVQSGKDPSSVGWLTWALADGYGGRALTDDVVDAGLLAIFGPLLNPNNVSPGLTTDNVNANDAAFLPAFPYLAPAH